MWFIFHRKSTFYFKSLWNKSVILLNTTYRVSNYRVSLLYALVCKGCAYHILFSLIIMKLRHETNCLSWFWVYKSNQKWKILKIQKKNFFCYFFENYALVCKGYACHILFSYIIMKLIHETNFWSWFWVYKSNQIWKILKNTKKNFFSVFFWKFFFTFFAFWTV